MTTIYHAYIEGFEATFSNLSDLREWANAKIGKYNLHGRTLKITEGYKTTGWNVYPSNANRLEITA